MSPQHYRQKYSKAFIETVCAKAGCTFNNFKQLCYGRKPSLALALALVEASGGELSLESLRPGSVGLLSALRKATPPARRSATAEQGAPA
jgi:hypothetical protein